MDQFIPPHPCDYLKRISVKINMELTKAVAEMKCDTEQTMKLGQLYKVVVWVELMAW